MLMVNHMKESIKKTYIWIGYENIRMYYAPESDDEEQKIHNLLEDYINWMCQLNEEQISRLLPKLYEAHRTEREFVQASGYTIHGCAEAEMHYIDKLKTSKDELAIILGGKINA